MTKGFFITGTDTGVGKTLVATALMHHHANLGRSVVGMKPVASGGKSSPEGFRNEDALALMEQATIRHPYSRVNPYSFGPAIAPHVAAAEAGVVIELSHLVATYRSLEEQADVVIVEGAGGWRVPIGPTALLSDLPETLGLGVIVVVGLRLGCLNHAILTCDAILQTGKAPLVGWIGNCIDPRFEALAANLDALRKRLPAPCLGIVPRLIPVSVASAAAALEIR